jgi:predicted RNA methylase
MPDLRDTMTWRSQLGLLPVPLFGSRPDSASAYVLLNGSRGNFCLYLDRQSQEHDSRSAAWSANVGHSVALQDDDVYIQRWDEAQSFSTKRLNASEVRADLDAFHRLLERDSPPSELSVVAHAVAVFRRLRTQLGPAMDGGDALTAFLVLLAAAIEGVDRQDIPLSKWQLKRESLAHAMKLDQAAWDALIDELLGGRKLENLKPDLSLTLRHASGMLFQEAHYAAVFERQALLPGFTPSLVTLQSRTPAIGLHFTPAAIVRTLAEEALRAHLAARPSITIFDPACGSGEFLREALRLLILNRYSGTVRLIGFDISPAACAMARFTLAWESRDSPERVDVLINSCDALGADTAWPSNVDLVLMNPPFQAWQDMNPARRADVSRVLGDLFQQRPDLSAAFLLKALASLADGGVLGTILPAPFLDGVHFKALRDELARQFNTLVVARLGSLTLFHEALVDACFYVGRRGGVAEVPLALWASQRPSASSAAFRTLRRLRASGSVTPDPFSSEAEGFSLYPNPDLNATNKPWTPRPYRQWQFDRTVMGLPRVGAHFDVRQGALTGLNRAFILTQAEWRRLPTTEQGYFRSAVFHESLRDGRIFDENYVFYPYGAYALDSEEELAERVPIFYKTQLVPNKTGLRARKGIDVSFWWRLTRPREWQAKPVKKIVSAYFGDAGAFAWDADGSRVVVQGYSWIPRVKTINRQQTWLAYLALLNSNIFAALLAANAPQVSGGQWNLSKRFLEPMALPKLYFDGDGIGAAGDEEVRAALANLGAKIHRDGLDALLTEERARLTELAEAVYLPRGAETDGIRP